MQRHVILLTDAHEAPAYELIEALSQAGVQTLIEGLREPSGRTPAKTEPVVHTDDSWGKLPLAVLYEVVPGADMVELHNALEQASTCWPDTPVIACRRQLSSFHGQSWRSLDGTALKRLGFRAIADKAAQLPAILREIEGHGATGELRLPEIVSSPLSRSESLLPARLKPAKLRGAFDLVAALHFIGDQTSAAHTALAGIVPFELKLRFTDARTLIDGHGEHRGWRTGRVPKRFAARAGFTGFQGSGFDGDRFAGSEGITAFGFGELQRADARMEGALFEIRHR